MTQHDSWLPYSEYLGAAIHFLRVSPMQAWSMSPREIHFYVRSIQPTSHTQAPSRDQLTSLLKTLDSDDLEARHDHG